MNLPNSSNSMYVANLRYIQTIHELAEHSSPDTMVRHFIPRFRRWRAALLGRERLSALRADPFYYYLVARTKYYDQVVTDALSDGVRQIIIVGSGSDTRAYRFKDLLRSKHITVLECDLPPAIHAKQQVTKRWRDLDYVEYMPVDLNDEAWPQLEQWMAARIRQKALVMMEGVSPYVNDTAFGRFLHLLSRHLRPRSRVAYDFKIRGAKDDFGAQGRTERPFRLSSSSEEAEAFHAAHGLQFLRMELSSDLCVRLLPQLAQSGPLFREDGLVQLEVGS